jgi:N-acetylglucosaminyldiphosphoundecaprenol N-acetyl-beta-D-mannosaminyltransferase
MAAHDFNAVPTDFDRPAHCLLGLPIDAIGLDEAVDHIRAAVSSRRPLFISTSNANYFAQCRSDAVFRRSIARSDLSLLDGVPILWIAKLLGMPIKERVAGADLFEAVVRGRSGPLNVFFFGGDEGVARTACSRINVAQGPVKCVGYLDPGFGTLEQMSDPTIIETINATRSDFVVVALGAQKGQQWIERNRSHLEAPVIAHLGATINFAAGRFRRAPPVVQRAGLEWLWRIKEEPRLLPRYLGDAATLVGLLVSRVLPLTIERDSGPVRPTSSSSRVEILDGRTLIVRPIGDFPATTLPELRSAFDRASHADHDVVVDLSAVGRVGSDFFGLLLLLYGCQSSTGRSLSFTNADRRVQRLFRLHCVEFLLQEPPARAAAD